MEWRSDTKNYQFSSEILDENHVYKDKLLRKCEILKYIYLEMVISGQALIYWRMNTDNNNSEWEKNKKRIKSFQDREEVVKNQCKYILAYAGFEAIGDKITCTYCNKMLKINIDEKRMNLDQVLEAHLEIEPNCKYLIPMVQQAEFESMKQPETRRKTFENGRIKKKFSRVTVTDLVEMGFFYEKNETEWLVCFQCGKKIILDEVPEHTSMDGLWKRHVTKRRYCAKMIEKKGVKFVEKYEPCKDVADEEERIRMLINEAFRDQKETANYVKRMKLRIN